MGGADSDSDEASGFLMTEVPASAPVQNDHPQEPHTKEFFGGYMDRVAAL